MRMPSLRIVFKTIVRILLVVVGLTVAAGGLFALKVLTREPLKAVPSTTHAKLDRKSCLECHAPIADEWRESYHHKSLTGQQWKDVREMGYMKIFDNIRKPCVNCHAPANVLDLPEQVAASGDSVLGIECTPNLVEDAKGTYPMVRSDDVEEGVDCVSCHVSSHGIVGSGRESSAVHEVLADPRFQDASLTSASFCVTCHLTAVRAWQQTKFAADGVTCLDCHMPMVNAPSVTGGPARLRRSHRFPADKDIAMLRSAVQGSLDIMPGRKARLRIANEHVGHFLPSGGNWLLVFLKTYDSSNHLVNVHQEYLGREETLLLDFWPFTGDSRIASGQAKEILVPLPEGTGKVEAIARYWDWRRVVKTVLRMDRKF